MLSGIYFSNKYDILNVAISNSNSPNEPTKFTYYFSALTIQYVLIADIKTITINKFKDPVAKIRSFFDHIPAVRSTPHINCFFEPFWLRCIRFLCNTWNRDRSNKQRYKNRDQAHIRLSTISAKYDQITTSKSSWLPFYDISLCGSHLKNFAPSTAC